MPLGTETTLPPSPAQVTTCGQSEPWLLLLLSLAEGGGSSYDSRKLRHTLGTPRRGWSTRVGDVWPEGEGPDSEWPRKRGVACRKWGAAHTAGKQGRRLRPEARLVGAVASEVPSSSPSCVWPQRHRTAVLAPAPRPRSGRWPPEPPQHPPHVSGPLGPLHLARRGIHCLERGPHRGGGGWARAADRASVWDSAGGPRTRGATRSGYQSGKSTT